MMPPHYDRPFQAGSGIVHPNRSIQKNLSMHKKTLLLLTALLVGCAPLRQSRSAHQETQIVGDSTLIRLLRRENDLRTGTLRQTVVEWQPAAAADTLAPGTAPPSRRPSRLIRTEITLRNDRTVETDSLHRRALQYEQRIQRDEQLHEQPSNGVQRLRWTGLLMALLAVIGFGCKRFRR